MVGTRKATPYGVEAAEKIAYGLCRQGALVVSGGRMAVPAARMLVSDAVIEALFET